MSRSRLAPTLCAALVTLTELSDGVIREACQAYKENHPGLGLQTTRSGQECGWYLSNDLADAALTRAETGKVVLPQIRRDHLGCEMPALEAAVARGDVDPRQLEWAEMRQRQAEETMRLLFGL